jgi:hypothetical protein
VTALTTRRREMTCQLVYVEASIRGKQPGIHSNAGQPFVAVNGWREARASEHGRSIYNGCGDNTGTPYSYNLYAALSVLACHCSAVQLNTNVGHYMKLLHESSAHLATCSTPTCHLRIVWLTDTSNFEDKLQSSPGKLLLVTMPLRS